MSIQSSINQGILATAALVSQNPEFQENKKEAAYEKKLHGTLNKLANTYQDRSESINKAYDESIQSGDEQLLYSQLERFKQINKNSKEFYEIVDHKFSEAKEHYIEKGDLKNYSRYNRGLEELKGIKERSRYIYKENRLKLKRAYWKAKYGKEFSGYIETNKELDKAEQIQDNTNNYHKMLKNKSKVDVVGERNGK